MTHATPWRIRLCGYAVAAIVVITVLASPLYMIGRSLWHDGALSFEAYREVLASPRQWTLLYNSVFTAGAAALFATVIAVPLGLSLWRLPSKHVARGFTALLTVPLLIPPYLQAIAWIDLLGAAANPLGRGSILFSSAGLIFINTISYFPIVLLTTIMALRVLDRRLLESARLTNGPWQTFIHVTLPLTGPPILAGSLFIYILAMINFNVASLLQVVTYPVEIYTRFNLSYSPDHATAQSIPLLFAGLAPVALWMVFARPRKGWMKRPDDTAQKASAPLATVAGIVYATFLAAVSVLLPVGLLVSRAGPLKTYGEAWATAKEEIVTSLIIASVSATALTLLAFVGAYLAHKGSRAAKAGQLAIVPFLISGPLIGIGLIFLWNRPGPAGLVYDSFAILVIATMARYAFLAHQGIAVALSALDPKLEEAAQVAGIPLWRQAGGIVMPILAPALVVAWALSFIYTFSEVDATILVCPPGWTTLPVRLHTLMHYGPSSLVAALSVITIAIIMTTAGAGAVAFGLLRRQLHGRH